MAERRYANSCTSVQARADEVARHPAPDGGLTMHPDREWPVLVFCAGMVAGALLVLMVAKAWGWL